MSLPENVPTQTLELDRPRTIALTVGAMKRIKEQTGESPQSALLDPDKVFERLGPFVWALLVNEDRADVSIEDVEEMLHPGNLRAVQDAIAQLGQKTAESAPGKAKARKRARAQK